MRIKLLSLLLVLFTSMYISAEDINTTIPKNFYVHKDNLQNSVDFIMGMGRIDHQSFTAENYYPYFSGLVEHESCISLAHSRCWSARSELYTKWPNGQPREQGVGFGQITRAWDRTGSIRLDVLNDLRRKYPKELVDLNWKNIKEEPQLQLKAVMLLWADNHSRLPRSISELDRMAMADSAYNGGYGYIAKDRKMCGLKAGCDPDLWFNNVETINNRGSKILYGTRTANQINRHHVKDVILIRMGKYYNIGWTK